MLNEPHRAKLAVYDAWRRDPKALVGSRQKEPAESLNESLRSAFKNGLATLLV